MFLGMKRFDDVKEVRVKDVKLLEGKNLEVYVRRSKTDREGKGSMFHMTGVRYGDFLILGLLKWYLESIGLQGLDYLCPRFQGSLKGGLKPLGKKVLGMQPQQIS